VSGLAYRTGVVYPASAEPAGLPTFAAWVEDLGFDTLWVIEDCFLSGGLTMAATALAVTESIGIGVGVGLLPVPVRNPAIAAMEIAPLGRIHPGRFEATLGHGVEVMPLLTSP
jgi:5,10-methylenetetrahydromethanopterin reductase